MHQKFSLTLLLLVLINESKCEHKNRYMFENRSTIVHLFEWKFEDIAKECEFLGQMGYGGVQTSPIQESRKEDPNSWLLRYQPVSYKIASRSGNIEEFQNMIKVCTENKVRVYVDVVLNQMAKGEGEIVGLDGSIADPTKLQYPGIYGPEDFNEFCLIKNLSNAFEIRNCRLDELPDLNQAKENVRNHIVEFLNRLIDYGVAGFRIDAVKHIWPMDLINIYNELKYLNTEFEFPPNAKPFIYQEVSDLGGEAVSKIEYIGQAAVTEFMHSQQISLFFRGKKPLHDLLGWGPKKGFAPSADAIVFVDNQDNQRLDDIVLNYKDRKEYIMANVFMLAHSYGTPRIMSSFDYETFAQGPPEDEYGNIKSREIDENEECQLPWICEHRWKAIKSMITFRNVVQNHPISNWADNGQNQIAFCRGNVGFIAFNNELSLNLKSNLKVCLPAGTYCDVINGEKLDNEFTGDRIIVDENNKAEIYVSHKKEVPIVAFHANSKL